MLRGSEYICIIDGFGALHGRVVRFPMIESRFGDDFGIL